MSFRSIAGAALLSLSAVAAVVVAPVATAASVDIQIGTPPPPPRAYASPPPRAGYVVVPGYWRWDGRRHVWVGPRYERARRGYHYAEPRWEQGPGGNYHFHQGRWER